MLESLKYNSLRLTHSEILSLNSQQKTPSEEKKTTSHDIVHTMFIRVFYDFYFYENILEGTLRSEIQESAYFFLSLY